MNEYVQRVTRITVLPKGDPIFSEQCTHVSIVDEAAGEFIEIQQQSDRSQDENQTVLITTEEWPAIKSAIETLLGEIQTWGKER